jgi:hypothetical protein
MWTLRYVIRVVILNLITFYFIRFYVLFTTNVNELLASAAIDFEFSNLHLIIVLVIGLNTSLSRLRLILNHEMIMQSEYDQASHVLMIRRGRY